LGHATLVARALQRLPGKLIVKISSEYTATERRFIPSNGPAALKTRKNKRFGAALAAGDCQSRSFKPTAGCGSAAPEPTWIALRFDIYQP